MMTLAVNPFDNGFIGAVRGGLIEGVVKHRNCLGAGIA
jgi:hypothetical protein